MKLTTRTQFGHIKNRCGPGDLEFETGRGGPDFSGAGRPRIWNGTGRSRFHRGGAGRKNPYRDFFEFSIGIDFATERKNPYKECTPVVETLPQNEKIPYRDFFPGVWRNALKKTR